MRLYLERASILQVKYCSLGVTDIHFLLQEQLEAKLANNSEDNKAMVSLLPFLLIPKDELQEKVIYN